MTKIRKDIIIGSRRFSNYWWATIILVGGLGFFLTGISSYLSKQIWPLNNSLELSFLPQGLVMVFYGTIAIIISIFIWYTIFLNVGSGYNEFDNKTKKITIFRLGFPGKNRILKLEYNLDNIQSIKIKIDQGISQKREIYLKTKDKRQIPLNKIDQPLSIKEIEQQASNLAKFLNVVLEGIE